MEKEWCRYQRELSNRANSEIGDRLTGYFATTHVAADLVVRLLKIGRAEEAEETISKLFDKVVVNAATHTDVAAKAMGHILSWARGNRNFFKSEGCASKTTEIYGVWKQGEFIAIRPHRLEEELSKKNFSPTSILKMWAERDWISRTPQRYTKYISIKTSERERMICIPWEIITFLEK